MALFTYRAITAVGVCAGAGTAGQVGSPFGGLSGTPDVDASTSAGGGGAAGKTSGSSSSSSAPAGAV